MSIKKQIPILLLVFVTSIFLSLKYGAIIVNNHELIKLFPLENIEKSNDILTEIRLPRVIGCLLVGMALSISGCIMQAIVKNPLADPSMLGISSGSNLFIVISMIIFPNISYLEKNLFSFLGGVVGTIIVILISKNGIREKNNYKLLLSGIAISTLFFSLSEVLSLKYKIFKETSMWINGGLMGININQLLIPGVFIIISIFYVLLNSRKLTILSFDEQLSISLGENTNKSRVIFLIFNVILAGSSVVLAGNLSFLGIFVPHISRKLVGNDYKNILPLSLIIGSTFFLLADLFSRLIFAPFEIPVNAVISILGLPFFLYIIKRKEL